MKKALLIITIILLYHITSHAEIEKIAIPCKEKMCFYWWPKLQKVNGWHQDKDYSYHYRVNAQAPDGFTFANAETVIYAKALFKPRNPNIKSLETLIQNDKHKFISRDSKIQIIEVKSLKSGDGTLLRSFTFFPSKQGNWEQVTYSEENEYYLIFTVSSRTKKGYLQSLNAYKQFINKYKKNP